MSRRIAADAPSLRLKVYLVFATRGGAAILLGARLNRTTAEGIRRTEPGAYIIPVEATKATTLLADETRELEQ